MVVQKKFLRVYKKVATKFILAGTLVFTLERNLILLIHYFTSMPYTVSQVVLMTQQFGKEHARNH